MPEYRNITLWLVGNDKESAKNGFIFDAQDVAFEYAWDENMLIYEVEAIIDFDTIFETYEPMLEEKRGEI